jgi:chromosome segregation ATPase
MQRTAILAVVALLGACASRGKTEGQKQIEDLTAQINKLSAILSEAKVTIQTTLAEHDQIVNNKDGDLLGHYKKFATGVDSIEDYRLKARGQLDKVKASAAPFFERWKQDITKFNNEEMRARAEERMQATRQRYDEVKQHSEEVRSNYEAMMATLRDHRLYWANDLNATSAADLADDRPALVEKANVVLAGVDSVIDWATKYNQSVAMRTSPPPAEGEGEGAQ